MRSSGSARTQKRPGADHKTKRPFSWSGRLGCASRRHPRHHLPTHRLSSEYETMAKQGGDAARSPREIETADSRPLNEDQRKRLVHLLAVGLERYLRVRLAEPS